MSSYYRNGEKKSSKPNEHDKSCCHTTHAPSYQQFMIEYSTQLIKHFGSA